MFFYANCKSYIDVLTFHTYIFVLYACSWSSLQTPGLPCSIWQNMYHIFSPPCRFPTMQSSGPKKIPSKNCCLCKLPVLYLNFQSLVLVSFPYRFPVIPMLFADSCSFMQIFSSSKLFILYADLHSSMQIPGPSCKFFGFFFPHHVTLSLTSVFFYQFL